LADAPFDAVDRLTLDQTASERVLHRVLYVLKFIRAAVLHVALAIVAALVFALTGVIGFYPVADSFIRAMRPGAIAQRQQFGAAGEWGYWLAAGLVFAAVIAFLVWVYRSITNVRPRALRVQAVVLVLIGVFSFFEAKANLGFAFAKLNLAFAVLASAASVLTMLVVPINIAVSLWQVSNTRERSSFVATLDPRLAPNAWTYLNKLLDLPRTPLGTVRTAAAYAIALAGAVLLIASLMYLLTMGGASNRLSTLAQICGGESLPQCVALSTTWAWQIPLALLAAALGIKASGWLQSLAKRLGGLGVSDVLKRPNDPFILYLRPFDTDDVVLPTPKLPPWSSLFSFRPLEVRVEEELFDVADGYRPLIAVGKPGGDQATPGGVAYRAYLDDSAWQDYVADKIRRAERIVLVMKDSDGVRWEIEQVIAEGATTKTLFLYDPAVTRATDREALERLLAPLLHGAGVAAQGLAVGARPIGFYFRAGTRVEIVNENRSATSYRTAFSTFLAESPA
jgi:hypothetical protein